MLWNEKKHYTFERQILWIELSVALLQHPSPYAFRIQCLATLGITQTGQPVFGRR